MQLLSPFGPQPPPAARALHSSPLSPPRPPPASNPCNNIPGLWFVKVGADAPQVVECTFVVEPGFAYMWGIQPPDESTAAANPTPNAKLRVVLLCLPTAAVITLYDSLRAAAPTPEGLAAAVAGLATAWPLDGTLILDMNRAGGGGNAWLPRDMDPTAPLDVTNYIRPGPNVIRFIQLASMLEHTFILYASPRESVNGPPQNAARDMDVDDDDAVPVQTGGMLFDFCATVTVS
ncbi:hypothetical protein DFH09DRAFT_1149982 [Mycena vulgaris]|nr:hypothetical protein DFH09DRAFT_1149982 [Mycena vulgaris]